MKKIIAFVLTVAMVLSVCAFAVSADTEPAVVLQGAANVVVGEEYTVTVRINDAADVAGVQGEVAYTGAEFKSIDLNPELEEWNDTKGSETIFNNEDGSVNFASLVDIEKTRVLAFLTFKITDTAPTFTIKNVKFANDAAVLISEVSTGTTLAPKTVEKTAVLNKVGMLNKSDCLQQGIVVNGKITEKAENIKEIGVVFYPTQLLGGEALTKDTPGAVVASETNLNDNALADFDAKLEFAYTTKAKAAKFLGVKVSSVIYYITNEDEVVYSANSVDEYIQNGVASKAVLNVALDKVADIDDPDLAAAIAGVSDADVDTMIANRETILEFAINAANAQ